MKKFTKVFVGMMVGVTAVASMLALTACGGNVTPVAKKMTDQAPEEYAFCVKEGNADMKAKLNAFFDKESTKQLINDSLAYHTGTSDTAPIKASVLADNTGETVTMVTEAGFAPYEYSSNSGDGVIDGVAGIDVDLMIAFAEENNYKVTVKNVEFNSINTIVNQSNMNIGAAGMTITEERELEVDFAIPYIETIQYVISAEDKGYETVAELAGLKVGVQTGTTGDLYVVAPYNETAEADAKIDVKQYDKVMAAFQALLTGKIDAVVIDEFVAKGLVENNNN